MTARKRIFIGIKIENFHITLLPPWQEEDLESVFGKVMEVAKEFEPFKIELKELVVSPPQSPGLIWLEIAPKDTLTSLKKCLEDAFGVSEKRDFLPHITVWRALSLEKSRVEIALDLEIKVDNITVFETMLLPSGAEYTVLKQATLGSRVS